MPEIEMTVKVDPAQLGYTQQLFILLAKHFEELPEEIKDCIYAMKDEAEKCK